MADDAIETRDLECRFQDDFDPFSLAQNGDTSCVAEATLKDNTTEQSDNYLASLEAKLNRLKGKTGRKIKAKEMLVSLSRSKEDALNRFVSQDSTMDSMETTEGSEVRTISELKRRMFPEQPLTSEELQCLLERDSLNQTGSSAEISPEPSGGSSS